MFHYAADMTFGMAVHRGQASSMINSMQIHVHGNPVTGVKRIRGLMQFMQLLK